MMRPLLSLLRVLVFSPSAVRDLIAENPRVLAGVLLLAGTAAWTVGRPMPFHPFSAFIEMVTLLCFVAFIYVPAAVVVCNAFAGDGLSLQISRQEYETNFVCLASLLGVLLLAAAGVSLASPEAGYLAVALGYLAYVPFVLKENNSIPWAAGAAAAVVLLLTFPIALLGMKFLLALPFFILAWLLLIGWNRLGRVLREQRLRGRFEQQLRQELINPHDADAYYQLGWLYLNRRRFQEAEKFFQKAVALQHSDPDYQYGLARARMEQKRWLEAFECLEKVYQTDPHYQMRDVLRDLGQVYFNLDYPEQAEQFLRAFLEERTSDAEGKYWLARVLIRKGNLEEARSWLRSLADRAETPGGFRKIETRRWKRMGRELASKIEQ